MKNFSLIMTLLFLSLTIVSCGSNGSDGKDATQQREVEKSILDLWVSTDESSYVDFTDLEFNTPSAIDIFYGSGEICSCTLVISGSESSGKFNVTSCFYNGGGSGDPGCFSNNSSNPYTKKEGILRICFAPNDCVEFR